MTGIASTPRAKTGRACVQIQDADRHVGRRLRERRIELGLTQQELADRLGVTYQQLHKYERGTNRLAAGRLYAVAQALDVAVGYFFEGLGSGRAVEPAPRRRELFGLARDFSAISDERQRQVVCDLARALAGTADLTLAA